jgi:hypothetical protein
LSQPLLEQSGDLRVHGEILAAVLAPLRFG